MTSLGLVIAVHEYDGELIPLPGCKHDGDSILRILQSEPRFEDILAISSNTKSKNIKSLLISFIEKHKGKKIDEFVFYYSGHGEYTDKDFFYLLTDYKRNHRNSTSLQNAELDNLIRSLNPTLFVKIVDACQSGINYIKSTSDLDHYLNDSKGIFNKLYFLYSSQYGQSSYQNNSISDFTASIISAINADTSGTVRYKDIIDAVSDNFEMLGHQTPHFIAQAEFTEVFCSPNQELKNAILPYLPKSVLALANTQDLNGKSDAIIRAIKLEAETYGSEAEATAVLQGIPRKFENIDIASDIREIFTQHVKTFESLDVPARADIGTWLESDKSDPQYFAKAITSTRTVKKKVPRNPAFIATITAYRPAGTIEPEYIYEEEQERYVSGFKITMDSPYKYISIYFESSFPNVSDVECFIVPLVSRTRIRLFWCCSRYEFVDWNSRKISDLSKWSTIKAPLKDDGAINEKIRLIKNNIIEYLEKPIRSKWGAKQEISLDGPDIDGPT